MKLSPEGTKKVIEELVRQTIERTGSDLVEVELTTTNTKTGEVKVEKIRGRFSIVENSK